MGRRIVENLSSRSHFFASKVSTAYAPSAAARRSTLAGISYGVGAGALWGLVFLAPAILSAFGPLQLAIGRYACYGLIAAVWLAPRWRTLRAHIGRREWGTLLWLALVGNTLYYVLLAAGVQNGGVAMTTLVIGFLPVAVTLVGSREQGAVTLGKLLPSLLLCAAGAVCIGWQALVAPVAGAAGRQWIGLACAVGALASWTIYAVGNTRALLRVDQVSAQDWNLLIGIVAGAQSLLLIPLALVFEPTAHDASAWLRFGAVSVGVAVLASIFGNALWNRMSRLLPLTLIGQMILFETIFALIYGFAWERRWPTPLELAALVQVSASVFSCMRAHRQPGVREPAN